MAAPTIFRSSDAGAATLNGNAGSLIAVLDACLVTGLGWSKAFTGTNKAVYRAPNGVRHYLDVDDSGPDGTALGRNARVRAYEVATAVGTGTGPFPTTAQLATSVGLVKSTTADGTARPWILVGDDRTFYLLNTVTGTTPPNLATNLWDCGMYFGEIYSFMTGDSYRSICSVATGTSTAVAAVITSYSGPTPISSTTTTTLLQFSPRSYTGSGGAIWSPIFANSGVSGTGGASAAIGGLQGPGYPNPVDGGLYINAIVVCEAGNGSTRAAASAFRGRLRGVLQPAHPNVVFNDQDTFSGTGDFAGRTFMLLKLSSSGMLAVETTAWETSS